MNHKFENQMEFKKLTFILESLKHPISVSAYEAELYQNYLVTSAAVGTLVAVYSDDRPAPFLAQSWSQKENLWIFKLRNGLKCENGEVIDAFSFAKSLTRSLRHLSKESDQPIFKKLAGYENFKNRLSDKIGIYAEDPLTLVFRFTEYVQAGFLEYLTMVPFGYLCSGNFNDKGDWLNERSIISSGPYRLGEYKVGDYYRLDKRSDFVLPMPEAPDQVFVRGGEISTIKAGESNIVYETAAQRKIELAGFSIIKQIPIMMFTASLSTNQGKFFSSNENRQAFAQVFRKKTEDAAFESFSAGKSKFIYPSQQTEIVGKSAVKIKVSPPIKPLYFFLRPPDSSGISTYINSVVLETLNELNWPYEIDKNPVTTFSNLQDTIKYDIRLTGSEVGGGLEPWITDMLFCSQVGPKFPDPSGRVCQLTIEQSSGVISLGTAVKKFNEAVFDDAALYPIIYKGGYFLISDNVEVASLSPMISRIRFEEFRFKK